jgi:hypothetical protein
VVQDGPLFAAFLVVSDDHRILVNDGRLETAIRTNERAGLFAESGEHRVKQTGERQQIGKPGKMPGRVVANNSKELVNADDVAQKQIADDKGKPEEDKMLGQLKADFARRPRRGGQGALGAGVAFDFVFDAAEDHFHEKSLRANPAAPEPAISGGENHDAGEKSSNATASSAMSCGQKMRPRMEKRRVTMLSISNGLPLILMNGLMKQNAQQQPAQIFAPLIKPALRPARIKPLTPPLFIRRGQMVAKILPRLDGGFMAGRLEGRRSFKVTRRRWERQAGPDFPAVWDWADACRARCKYNWPRNKSRSF